MVSKFRLAQIIADSSIRGIGGQGRLVPCPAARGIARLRLGRQLDDVPREPLLRMDTEGKDAFVATVRDRDPYGLGRFEDDFELLTRAGVTARDGIPSGTVRKHVVPLGGRRTVPAPASRLRGVLRKAWSGRLQPYLTLGVRRRD